MVKVERTTKRRGEGRGDSCGHGLADTVCRVGNAMGCYRVSGMDPPYELWGSTDRKVRNPAAVRAAASGGDRCPAENGFPRREGGCRRSPGRPSPKVSARGARVGLGPLRTTRVQSGGARCVCEGIHRKEGIAFQSGSGGTKMLKGKFYSTPRRACPPRKEGGRGGGVDRGRGSAHCSWVCPAARLEHDDPATRFFFFRVAPTQGDVEPLSSASLVTPRRPAGGPGAPVIRLNWGRTGAMGR